MRRHKGTVCRRSDSPSKQDTPAKPAVKRLEKLRRFASCKLYEALREEPEVEEAPAHARPLTFTSTDPMQTHGHHVLFSPVLHVRSPLFAANPRDDHVDVLPATTADAKPSYQASPAAPPTLQSHCGRAAKAEQNLSATPESLISSGVESDTLSSDDDDEDCNSSASPSGCSLPSPEIFRREIHAETETEPLCVHPHIRNSTLLEVSHARSIHMHQPLDLSAIIDSSRVKAKNSEMSINKDPEADTEMKKASFKSVKDMKYITPANPTKKRPIMCKRNVIFKSPILTEIFSPAECRMHCTADPVQTSSQADQPSEKKEDALRLKVPLSRPAKRRPDEAKFFDFVSDSDEGVFFNMMRERAVRLKSAPLFPLTAAKYTVASVL